jgi:hypothetical protein
MIGIKVADGAFFPVLAGDTAAKKRLVLTTAHDSQTSVQIDFFRAASASMHNASYIGTLLIDDIQKKKKGSPSIELIISLDSNGEFLAGAHDLDRPEDKNNHILTVSLSQQQDLDVFDDIDFDQGYAIFEDEILGKYATNIKTSKPKLSKPAVIIVSVIVLFVLAAFCLWFFVFGPRSAMDDGAALTEIPAVETPPPSPPVEQIEIRPPQVSVLEQESPLITAPDVPVVAVVPEPRKLPSAPVSSYKAPPVIPAAGISYKLRWGDTLWDVSQAFYRTPWRYRHLASYNGIRNPNRVIAGTTIRIPPLPK